MAGSRSVPAKACGAAATARVSAVCQRSVSAFISATGIGTLRFHVVRSCCTRSPRSPARRRIGRRERLELDDERFALGELRRRARSGGGCG